MEHPEFLQCLVHEAQGRALGADRRDVALQYLPLVVNGTPEVDPLVKVPAPMPHPLMADVVTALEQQVRHIAQ